MKHFIDTNMTIGYTFEFDKWHAKSHEFLIDNENIHWSSNVKKEFYEKFTLCN